MEAAFRVRGGPPDGLMVHLTCPESDGIAVIEAWRDEAGFRSFMSEVVQPAAEQLGLALTEPVIGPAWSIARP